MKLVCATGLMLLALSGVHAITIVTEPQNTTALENTNATIPCLVSDQVFGENVVWNKIANGVTTTISTNNLVTASTSKYAIAGNYNLTIISVVTADEGSYECSISNNANLKKSAMLTVASNVTSVSLLWPGNSETVTMGVQSNLTCRTGTSRPPASFRWFRGNIDITNAAYNPNPSTDTNGYGSSYSVQTLTLYAADKDTVIKCIVDLNDLQNVYTKEIKVTFSGSSVQVAVTSLTMVAVLLSYISQY